MIAKSTLNESAENMASKCIRCMWEIKNVVHLVLVFISVACETCLNLVEGVSCDQSQDGFSWNERSLQLRIYS